MDIEEGIRSVTSNELDVLQALWRLDKPAPISELVLEANRPRKWSDPYCRTLVYSLENKKLARFNSYVVKHNIKCKLYEAAITLEEFAAVRLKEILLVTKENKLNSILQYLIDDDDLDSDRIFEEVERLIFENVGHTE